MKKNFIEDQSFKKIDFTLEVLTKGDYEHCTFIDCDFSNTSLSEIRFSECKFIDCNLSMVKMNKTALQEIEFKNCKLLGIDFDTCEEFLFAVTFDSCLLNHASFIKMKLKNSTFDNCILHEVDFTEADLSGIVFSNCDLTRAKFERTVLEKADFRTAIHYAIDPENNKIKKAKFSAKGLIGLLGKYGIEVF